MFGQWEWGIEDPGMWESASWNPDWSSIYDFSSVDIGYDAGDMGTGITSITGTGVSVPSSGGFDILGVLKSILGTVTPIITPVISTILTAEQKQAQAQAQAQQVAQAKAQQVAAAQAAQGTTTMSAGFDIGSSLPILAIIAAGIFMISRKKSPDTRSRRKR